MRAVILVAIFAFSLMAPQVKAADAPAVVFFELWSGALSDSALVTITKVSEQAKAQPKAKVEIVGYADPTGSIDANASVANLRTLMVRDALVANGIPVSRIDRQIGGVKDFVSMSLESRRVEIRLVGP